MPISLAASSDGADARDAERALRAIARSCPPRADRALMTPDVQRDGVRFSLLRIWFCVISAPGTTSNRTSASRASLRAMSSRTTEIGLPSPRTAGVTRVAMRAARATDRASSRRGR